MGSSSGPSMPKAPQLQMEAPDWGDVFDDVFDSYMDAVPQLLEADYQARLKYDLPLRMIQLEGDVATAWRMADEQLKLQQQYGTQYTTEARKRLEEMDPEAFHIRGKLGRMIEADLGLGGQLDPWTQHEVSQTVRGGQTARGQMFGNAAIFEEAMQRGQMAEARKQQRYSNASGFIQGRQLIDQAGAIGNTQQGAAPWTPVQNPGYFQTYNPDLPFGTATSVYNAQTQFASDLNRSMVSLYGAQSQAALGSAQLQAEQGNSWMEGLGTIVGLAATVAAGFV